MPFSARKPGIGFVLVLLLGAALTPRAEADVSKVFSMNLHCAEGHWRSRLDEIVAELVRTQPQVMAFQEVCRNWNVDTALYIVDKLIAAGVPVTFWKTVNTHLTFFKYQEELLLISTVPVHSYAEGKLPSLIFFRNNFLGFQVDDFWVVTTHLHWWLSSIRKAQYKRLARVWSGRPVLLLGDMNSNPTDRETKPFKKAGWVPIFDGPTFPAEKPTDTFDGFWFSPELSKRLLGGRMRRVFVKESQEHEPPSDHLGVALDFILEK